MNKEVIFRIRKRFDPETEKTYYQGAISIGHQGFFFEGHQEDTLEECIQSAQFVIDMFEKALSTLPLKESVEMKVEIETPKGPRWISFNEWRKHKKYYELLEAGYSHKEAKEKCEKESISSP